MKAIGVIKLDIRKTEHGPDAGILSKIEYATYNPIMHLVEGTDPLSYSISTE